jgi:glycosidase
MGRSLSLGWLMFLIYHTMTRPTQIGAALLALALLALASCKNYIGNPHARSLPPKTVPAVNDIRVDPPNWWTGMTTNQIELLVHRKDVAGFEARLGRDAIGVRILKTEKGDSPNYIFLTLEIAKDAPPQQVPLLFTQPQTGAEFAYTYPLYQRNTLAKAQGVDSRDAIYLIFPDRFANGDTTNDRVSGMREEPNRSALTGRHGGDLPGILQHLDYIEDLGITAIWLNPELENDQMEGSYHGYALTDHYKVDRRLGSNELLRDLVRNCHERGMKVIRDVVPNHTGDKHWWMEDLPCRDWLNPMKQTSYKAPTILDPYASEYDKRDFNDGWFVPTMPDLNQRNPHLANYLIQHAIWWIEYAGFDAFRIDTYTYADQGFMSRFCAAVRKEYPKITMFGEIWEHGVITQGFFADNQPIQKANFDSNLPGVIDFQITYAIQEALNKPQGWTEGVSRIYYTLAKDIFYEDPYRNMIMLDNHDMSRFYTVVGEDINKFKCGMAFLLTMRGVPQIYYGTEMLSTGYEAPSHGNIRKDFPGGWPGDAVNKFAAEGRTTLENEAFNYTRALLRYRKSNPVLQTGKLMQFVPYDGVYAYFRYDEQKTVMVVMNTAQEERTLELTRFAERIKNFKSGKEVVSGKEYNLTAPLQLKPYSALVIELRV